jgi:hypothetical protein
MCTMVPLIARTPRKNAIDSIQKVVVFSAAAASMPGNGATLAARVPPAAGTQGGSRTQRTTGSQARTTTATARPT